MLNKYDIEKIKDGRFYSASQKCFVEIKGHVFKVNGKTIDLDTVLISDTATQTVLSDIIYDSKTKHRLEKRTSYAFKKNVFLLGKNDAGKLVWLEEPCWYWGFGYIEVYTSNNPDRAKDIQSHSHFSGMVGQQEIYKDGHWRKGEYVNNVYDSPVLVETAFSKKEGWELSELFKQFYLLQNMAAFCNKEKPGCHITSSPVDHGNMKLWSKEINETMIPRITAKIMEILSPVKDDNK